MRKKNGFKPTTYPNYEITILFDYFGIAGSQLHYHDILKGFSTFSASRICCIFYNPVDYDIQLRIVRKDEVVFSHLFLFMQALYKLLFFLHII